MAQNDIKNPLEFIDKRRATRAGSNAAPVTTPANFLSISGMRARLAAAAPSTYTTARLEQMTRNDMVMALRQLDEATSI
jgi:hypothetical protein